MVDGCVINGWVYSHLNSVGPRFLLNKHNLPASILNGKTKHYDTMTSTIIPL